jgi:catechol 2,3-dioxygenase-like lactoylglutathione lyase family enzyme
MAIDLNHTIVHARDPKASARFLADLLDLPIDPPVAGFTPITLANRATLDYLQRDKVEPQHYAFMLSDSEFDAVFARIRDAGVTHYADPGCRQAGQIYRLGDRRGTYFHDPDGHLMEILTGA